MRGKPNTPRSDFSCDGCGWPCAKALWEYTWQKGDPEGTSVITKRYCATCMKKGVKPPTYEYKSVRGRPPKRVTRPTEQDNSTMFPEKRGPA